MVLRRLMVALLVAWCVLGAASTFGALTGPNVWWNESDAPVFDVVGTPLRGAAEVTVIRSLLADVPRDEEERWLVLFPPQSDETVLLYIRFQLAHLEYPRRVDVMAAVDPPRGTTYGGVITAPGMQLGEMWLPRVERGGFTRHAVTGS